MPCALCNKDRPLQNSHIIPEFLYETLYDSKHRFYHLSMNPEVKEKSLQKGVREPLLCECCEQYFSTFERYASLALSGKNALGYKHEDKRVIISGLEYQKFKLFQLSILWRAGISSLTAFRQVSLGPHESRLRQMLIASDPGAPHTYGCLMFALIHEGQIVEDLIMEPTWARLDGHYCYRFVFGGLIWVYLVSGHQVQKRIVDDCLQTNGDCVVRLQDFEEVTFPVKVVAKLHRIERGGGSR